MRRTALIVEPELELLRKLRDAVRTARPDLEVLTAGEPSEAMELLNIAPVDLVIASDAAILEEACSSGAVKGIRITANASSTADRTANHVDVETLLDNLDTFLSPPGFRGASLLGFSLTDLLQLLSMSRQSMSLRVEHDGATGRLYIENGTLIHATTANHAGRDAAREILSWAEGDISSTPGHSINGERTMAAPLAELLVEVACERDEQERSRATSRALADVQLAIPKCMTAGVFRLPDMTTIARAGVEAPNFEADRAAVASAFSTLLEKTNGALPTKEVMLADDKHYVLAHVLLDRQYLACVWIQADQSLDSARRIFDDARSTLQSALTKYT